MRFPRLHDLQLQTSSRWCTPWSPISPILNLGLVALVFSITEDVEQPPDFLSMAKPIWQEFSVTVGAASVVVVLGPLFLYRHGWFLRSTTAIRPLRMVCFGVLAGLTLKSVYFFTVWYWFDSDLGRSGMSDDLWGTFSFLVPAFLVGALVFPLWEEWLFRILVYGSARKRLSPHLAILLTAALFAIGHGLSWSTPMALVLGLVTSTVYERTRSFAFCFAMHGAGNFTALALRLLVHRHGVFS